MKKIFSIFFLLLILLQSGGMIWWFKVQQFSIQYEMSERIKNQNASFEMLDITQQEYFSNIKDDGKEIELNGKLYDIKSVELKNGRARICAVNDSKEENLIRRFAHFIKHSKDNQKQTPTTITQLIVLTYIIPSSEFSFAKRSHKTLIGYHQFFPSKTFQATVFSPPPEFIS